MMQVIGGASQANDEEPLCPRGDSLAVGMATCPPPLPVLQTRPLAPVAPPPPPPPPMPHLLPVFGDLADGMRKRRVRSFFWKTIPEDQVDSEFSSVTSQFVVACLTVRRQR